MSPRSFIWGREQQLCARGAPCGLSMTQALLGQFCLDCQQSCWSIRFDSQWSSPWLQEPCWEGPSGRPHWLLSPAETLGEGGL